MGLDWLSGGFVVALAAVLWLAYLLPSWFRRNEYLATEKNAVRLQQTLRILAETSEVPEEVRAEANARSVVEQQRRLKKVIMESTPTAVLQAAKIKRSRALTSLLLFLALVTTVLGGMQIALTGAWVIMLGGAIVSLACVLRLGKLAKMGRALRLPANTLPARRPVAQEFADHGADFEVEQHEIEEAEASAWTPVEIPRPLYLTRRAPVTSARATAGSSAEVDHAEQLRSAAARAEAALRQAAEDETERVDERAREIDTVAPVFAAPTVVADAAPTASGAPASSGQSTKSRYAAMGVVDDVSGTFDLDKVMARRRTG